MKIKVPNYLTIGRIIIVPIFVITFYLTSFLPLSSISSPSLPLKTLHELNLLASK